MEEIKRRKLNFYKHSSLEGIELSVCSDNSYSLPPHFDSDYCIWMNNSCMETYTFGGNTLTLEPGSFGIIEPGDVHSNRHNETESRYLMTFYLSEPQLRDTALQIDEKSQSMRFATNSHYDRLTVKTMVKLHRLMQFESPSLEIETAYLELLSHLMRSYGTSRLKVSQAERDEKRVERAVDIFHSCYSDDITLGYLAEDAGCTPYHLIRVFKKSVGISPYAYLLQVRLERVKHLIRQGRRLADAAFEAGFADQSHMHRNFKKRYGITPGVYKRQVSPV